MGYGLILGFKGSRALVTGGCGFIGSHLVKKLLRLGVAQVTIIDDLRNGEINSIPRISRKVRFIKHTIGSRNHNVLFNAMHGIDYVFHLAALKHSQSGHNQQLLLDLNVNGAFQVFNSAITNRVKKIVFASSLYAYGRIHSPALRESDSAKPTTVYGVSKLTGECLLDSLAQKYGIPYVSLRYFFVYGPRQSSNTSGKTVIIRNFERIMKKENPVIYGDGDQVFDYIYIDDIIDATIYAAAAECSGEIFNVGSGIPASINQLTDMMIEIARVRLKKTYYAPDDTQGTYRVADISKIKKMLGFHPVVSLREGLKQTYKWLKRLQE